MAMFVSGVVAGWSIASLIGRHPGRSSRLWAWRGVEAAGYSAASAGVVLWVSAEYPDGAQGIVALLVLCVVSAVLGVAGEIWQRVR